VPPEHKPSFRTCQRSTGSGGSAIVVVLLLTAALTVLGVMSINSGLIELQLVRNGKEGTKRFYLAESAALEGIQRIADTKSIDLEDKILHWHHAMADVEKSEIDFRKPEAWQMDGKEGDNAVSGTVEKNVYIAAVEWRLATGSSAIVTGSRLYLNRIYGLCNRDDHPFIVEVGYYKRY